jgi:hypothetical protein
MRYHGSELLLLAFRWSLEARTEMVAGSPQPSRCDCIVPEGRERVFPTLRDYMRSHLPPSSRKFNRAIKSVRTELEHSNQHTAEALAELTELTRHSLDRVDTASHEHALSLERVEAALAALQESAAQQDRTINEALWAHTFNSTISSSDWLRDTAFSPGRWAVGYPYLYVLYRVLNEARPSRVLDLGLGQSSRMISQYAATHDGVEHIVVEHDQDWIDFFERDLRLTDRTRLLKLDLDYVRHKEAASVRVYSGLAEAIGDTRLDLISIDGPLGDMAEYARIDLLGIVPECLAPSFVIMLDDYERTGESHAMREMQDALSDAGVDTRLCVYSGSKDLGLLCSADSPFLCSM